MANRLLRKLVLLIALVAVVEGLILFGPGNRHDRGDPYLAAWSAKHRRLLAPGRHRLLLAGGSNIAFGVDSSRLHAVTDRNTINLGLHGGLGLALMLHEIEDGARAGDLVVLIPEYEHFFGDVMNGQLPAAELLRYDWLPLPYFSSRQQWKNLVRNSQLMTSAALFTRIEQARLLLLGRPRQSDDAGASVYRREAFDEHGDLIGNSDRESLPDRVAASGERIRGEFNQAAVDEIVRCAGILAGRGVDFVVIYPSVSATYWSLNQDLARQVAARIPRRWTVTSPEDWVFDDWLFYDSSYHLNHSGREVRTERLIRALRNEQVAQRLADLLGRHRAPGQAGWAPWYPAPEQEPRPCTQKDRNSRPKRSSCTTATFTARSAAAIS